MPFAAIAAGISAAGAIGGAAISSSAAGNASKTQANAANYSADISAQQGQNALQFQQGEYGNTLSMAQPWLSAGYGSLANLESLLGLPVTGTYPTSLSVPGIGGLGPNAPNWPGGTQGGLPAGGSPTEAATPGTPATTAPLSSLVNPSLGAAGSLNPQPFVQPTDVTEQNDPGYQFRLQQGLQALEQSASASGGLLSGGTAKAEQQYGQNYASNEYTNVYNRALTNYNTGIQNQTNTFNRLATLAGIGQTSTQQVAAAGQAAAGNVSSTSVNTGQNIGSALQTGALRSSGYQTGAANAWANSLGSVGNLASLYAMLNYNYGGSNYVNYAVPSDYTLGG